LVTIFPIARSHGIIGGCVTVQDASSWEGEASVGYIFDECEEEGTVLTSACAVRGPLRGVRVSKPSAARMLMTHCADDSA